MPRRSVKGGGVCSERDETGTPGPRTRIMRVRLQPPRHSAKTALLSRAGTPREPQRSNGASSSDSPTDSAWRRSVVQALTVRPWTKRKTRPASESASSSQHPAHERHSRNPRCRNSTRRRHTPARFPSQIPAGDPQQRIEPIDRPHQLCGHLDDPVSATYVRKLVAKHRMNAFDRPRRRAFRHQHSRTSPSPREENGEAVVLQKTWRIA